MGMINALQKFALFKLFLQITQTLQLNNNQWKKIY
jgi:hypothetical protein